MKDHLFKIANTESEPSISEQSRAEDLFGMFPTTTVAPTAPPKGTLDQIQFVTDSLTAPSTYKLYFYSDQLNVWKSVTLT